LTRTSSQPRSEERLQHLAWCVVRSQLFFSAPGAAETPGIRESGAGDGAAKAQGWSCEAGMTPGAVLGSFSLVNSIHTRLVLMRRNRGPD
jgi:hypothetical protein